MGYQKRERAMSSMNGLSFPIKLAVEIVYDYEWSKHKLE